MTRDLIPFWGDIYLCSAPSPSTRHRTARYMTSLCRDVGRLCRDVGRVLTEYVSEEIDFQCPPLRIRHLDKAENVAFKVKSSSILDLDNELKQMKSENKRWPIETWPLSKIVKIIITFDVKNMVLSSRFHYNSDGQVNEEVVTKDIEFCFKLNDMTNDDDSSDDDVAKEVENLTELGVISKEDDIDIPKACLMIIDHGAQLNNNIIQCQGLYGITSSQCEQTHVEINISNMTLYASLNGISVQRLIHLDLFKECNQLVNKGAASMKGSTKKSDILEETKLNDIYEQKIVKYDAAIKLSMIQSYQDALQDMKAKHMPQPDSQDKKAMETYMNEKNVINETSEIISSLKSTPAAESCSLTINKATLERIENSVINIKDAISGFKYDGNQTKKESTNNLSHIIWGRGKLPSEHVKIWTTHDSEARWKYASFNPTQKLKAKAYWQKYADEHPDWLTHKVTDADKTVSRNAMIAIETEKRSRKSTDTMGSAKKPSKKRARKTIDSSLESLADDEENDEEDFDKCILVLFKASAIGLKCSDRWLIRGKLRFPIKTREVSVEYQCTETTSSNVQKKWNTNLIIKLSALKMVGDDDDSITILNDMTETFPVIETNDGGSSIVEYSRVLKKNFDEHFE